MNTPRVEQVKISEGASNSLTDDAIISELQARIGSGDIDLGKVANRLDLWTQDEIDDLDSEPKFESLQHQQLFEEFEEARKKMRPQDLFTIFQKINRPDLHPDAVVIR